MKIYRYWAKERIDVAANGRGPMNLSCWRWSDRSVEDAMRSAREALDGVREQWQQGQDLDRYSYSQRALREEIVEEIEDRHGDRTAAITRNAYGSLVLNTERVMFIDVDFAPVGLVGSLRRLFGGKRNGNDPQAAAILENIRTIARSSPDLGVRVYRTRKGLRLLVTSRLFDPNSPEAKELLERFGSDPLYVRLCVAQECFRARLTPKHWRCGIERPPSRYPWDNARKEREYRQWVIEYESAVREFGTCRLLETLGSNETCREAEPIVELHDRMACAAPELELA